ncbi:MAG: hypothetical protein ACLUFL_01960 [Flavonifractor plautii]
MGIAQALLGNPLPGLDEPTVGLDPEERIHFRNLFSAQPRTAGASPPHHERMWPVCDRSWSSTGIRSPAPKSRSVGCRPCASFGEGEMLEQGCTSPPG